MEKKIDPKGKEKKQTNRKKWYKAVCSLAAAVVVCTVYTLMLPALTLDEESAGDAGVTISESSVPASESPAAAESSPSDNGSESHSDTAADSSADSSPASTESGPAAAAPSADSAPSTNEPTTLPSKDGENHAPVTLPAEETNNGAITGSSESQDEITTPDTDDQEEIKDEESGSPAADQEEADSDSSSDADDEDISDPTADVEDASIWEATIPDLSNYTTWADKLVAVAQSQLGYKESVLNFNVKDGEHKGYTRYGEWYGSPYGDWCAMFVSFCLNYAGIENNDSIIPHNANCQTWVEQLTTNKIFEDPDTYLPEPGDIVFFDQKGNEKADHVGIVSDVEYGTKTVKRHVVVGTETAVEDSAIALLTYANSLTSEETPAETLEATETEVTVAKSIEVIEGNSSDQVQTVTYDMTDDSIIGFASMLEAEYINDGGDIDDIKNTNQIKQPVTLENQIAVQSISGNTIVSVNATITLTGEGADSRNDFRNHEWKSSDESIATVKAKNNKKYEATVTGVKEGEVTITHTYEKYEWVKYNEWPEWSEYEWVKHKEIYPVAIGTSDVHKAAIYFLKSPDGVASSNDTSYWAPTSDKSDFIGKINISDATWDKNKNIIDNVNNHIVSWPDNTTNSYWTLERPVNESEYATSNFGKILDSIWDKYEEYIRKTLNINDLKKDEIKKITLTPYKISRDNSSTENQYYHIDCTISVDNPRTFTAEFRVKEPDMSDYKPIDAKEYNRNDNGPDSVEKTSKIEIGTTKDFDGETYILDGWYVEDSTGQAPGAKVDSWNHTPTDEQLSDGKVIYYAHYIPATVKYAVGQGLGKVSDPITGKYEIGPVKESLYKNKSAVETTKGSTAEADTGWVFEGWYKDPECTQSVDSDWVANEKITPKKNNDGTWEGIAGKTYYAKFVSSVELPETGAPGTTLIYLLGAMLTTAPLTITFIKRRRQKKEEN